MSFIGAERNGHLLTFSNLFSLLLLALLALTAPGWADTVSYVEGSWDSTTKKLTYTLHDGTSAANSTPVTHDTTTWNGGWHYVTGDVTIFNRITVTVDVHLILCDGAKLTATAGASRSPATTPPSTSSQSTPRAAAPANWWPQPGTTPTRASAAAPLWLAVSYNIRNFGRNWTHSHICR